MKKEFDWNESGATDRLFELLKEREKRSLEGESLTYYEIAQILTREFNITFTGEQVRAKIRRLRKELKRKDKIRKTEHEIITSQLREQISHLTKELNSYKELLRDTKSLYDLFEGNLDKIPLVDYIPTIKADNKLKEEEVNLMWSDQHAAEVVVPEEIENFNQYNFDIFASRLWGNVKDVIQITNIMRHGFKIKTLNLYGLGDHVTGDIHEEYTITNDHPIIVTVLMVASIFSQALAILSQEFETINIACVPGNHARLTKRKQYKQSYNNYDYMIWQIVAIMMSHYVSAGRMSFIIPKSPEIVVDRMGWKFLLSHGDEIRAWAGIPFYGIARDEAKQKKMRNNTHIKKLLMKTQEDLNYHYRLMAHFHNPNVLENVLMNGSMIGPENFGKNALHVASPPSQKFFGLNEKYGVSWVYDLFCCDSEPSGFIYDPTVLDQSLTKAMSKIYDPFFGEFGVNPFKHKG